MENAGQQFTRNFIHIRQHQHQSLAGRIGAGQRTALKRAVDGSGSTALMLHLPDVHSLPKQVLPSLRAPFIHQLSHGRRWRDGVNGSYFSKRIRCIRCSGVAIHGYTDCFLFHLHLLFCFTIL